MSRSSKKWSVRGNAIIELTLMMPWIFFLFVGALDFGFYAYAAISVQNAARVAALGAATSEAAALDTDQACLYVREELAGIAYDRTLNPAVDWRDLTCNGAPLWVNVQRVTAADAGIAPVLTPAPFAARVTVTFETIPLIPIPGVVPGKLQITRTAEVRIFG